MYSFLGLYDMYRNPFSSVRETTSRARFRGAGSPPLPFSFSAPFKSAESSSKREAMRSSILFLILLALVAVDLASALAPLRRIDAGPQRLDCAKALSPIADSAIKGAQAHADPGLTGDGGAPANISEGTNPSAQAERAYVAMPPGAAPGPASVNASVGYSELKDSFNKGVEELPEQPLQLSLKGSDLPKSAPRKRCYYIGTFFHRYAPAIRACPSRGVGSPRADAAKLDHSIDCNAAANSTAVPYSHASAPVATQV